MAVAGHPPQGSDRLIATLLQASAKMKFKLTGALF
jgi:hypothetical protein